MGFRKDEPLSRDLVDADQPVHLGIVSFYILASLAIYAYFVDEMIAMTGDRDISDRGQHMNLSIGPVALSLTRKASRKRASKSHIESFPRAIFLVAGE